MEEVDIAARYARIVGIERRKRRRVVWEGTGRGKWKGVIGEWEKWAAGKEKVWKLAKMYDADIREALFGSTPQTHGSEEKPSRLDDGGEKYWSGLVIFTLLSGETVTPSP